MLWIHPSRFATRMKMNSAIEKPTRNISERTVRLLWPLSRIRKNSAEARLPRISRNAMATTMRMELEGLEMGVDDYLTGWLCGWGQ